jgi:hypothetical protein
MKFLRMTIFLFLIGLILTFREKWKTDKHWKVFKKGYLIVNESNNYKENHDRTFKMPQTPDEYNLIIHFKLKNSKPLPKQFDMWLEVANEYILEIPYSYITEMKTTQDELILTFDLCGEKVLLYLKGNILTFSKYASIINRKYIEQRALQTAKFIQIDDTLNKINELDANLKEIAEDERIKKLTNEEANAIGVDDGIAIRGVQESGLVALRKQAHKLYKSLLTNREIKDKFMQDG